MVTPSELDAGQKLSTDPRCALFYAAESRDSVTQSAGAIARSAGTVTGIQRASRLLLLLCLFAAPLCAQEPVNPWADAASWGTALVNPSVAAVKAARGADPWCHLGQLGLSELIGNGSVMALKHFIVSPRPCAGCDSRGMPSGHSMNSVLGVSSNWRFGLFFSLGTVQLRQEAHRHTRWQTAAGAALGGLSELAGQKLLQCKE